MQLLATLTWVVRTLTTIWYSTSSRSSNVNTAGKISLPTRVLCVVFVQRVSVRSARCLQPLKLSSRLTLCSKELTSTLQSPVLNSRDEHGPLQEDYGASGEGS